MEESPSPTSEPTTISTVKLPSIPSLLEDYQCHFTWVAQTNESNPFTKEQAEMIQNLIAKKFEPKDYTSTLRYNGMKVIADKCTQAFCNIVLNNLEVGKFQIKEADALTHQCILENHFPQEYAEGFYYITKGLHLLQLCYRIEIGSESKEVKAELDKKMRHIGSFDELSPKSQVAVKVVKYLFFDKRLDKSPQAEQLLKEIIEMDDNYYQWHYELYKLLRAIRRSSSGHRNRGKEEPTEQEKSKIIKATELAPDNPFITLGLCQCLSETFRVRVKNLSRKNPIELGSLTFDYPDEVVDFVRQKCSEVEQLSASGFNGSVYRTIGAFFSSVLPKEYRDYKFAEQCITKGLKISPKSSKLNHRMGLIVLNDKSKSQAVVVKALSYFKIAVKSDPRSFPALSSLIKTYMSDCNLHAEELENIFQTNLNNLGQIWSKNELGNLYYFFGLFKYMRNDENAAIDHWIKAYPFDPENPDSDFTEFHNLKYHSTYHRWTVKDISESTIANQVASNPYASGKVKREGEIVRKILKNLKANEEDWRSRNSNPVMVVDAVDETRLPSMRSLTITTGNKKNPPLSKKEEGPPAAAAASTSGVYRPPYRREGNHGAMDPPSTARNSSRGRFQRNWPTDDNKNNNGAGDRNRLGSSSSSLPRNRND